MSIVCNMVGGASGGGGLVSSEAVIAVYVDVGTTVTMTKGLISHLRAEGKRLTVRRLKILLDTVRVISEGILGG